jgi:natural product biosynthesis luciferase-like monooxygenase protein/amino acid adenylation domain-containing protein/non-ribosomal peptide synthase protein (TIGR01720 family)
VSASPPGSSPLPLDGGPDLLARLQVLAARALRLAPGRIDPGLPLAALGLDSLAAVELRDGIEAELGSGGGAVPVERLLDGMSLAELAREIRSGGERPAPLPVVPPAVPGAALPLSQGQRALWFLDRLRPGDAAYVLAGAVRVRGPLNVPALARALTALAERHPVLGSTFAEIAGRPVRRVGRPEIGLAVEDAASALPADLAERLRAAAFRPFDLARGPLLRAAVFRRAPEEHAVVLSVHHIVADFASLAVLARELGPLYIAATGGAPAVLPPLAATYEDHVAREEAQLASSAGERLWELWRQELLGCPLVLDLPADRPRAREQVGRGASERLVLPDALSSQLAALARRSGATLYMALLAAFQALLARESGQEDLLVGSPSAGRGTADLAGAVGYFVNPLVLRGDLAGDPPFTEILARVRRRALAAFAGADYPFAVLAERLQPERDPARSPVFQVFFSLQGGRPEEEGLAALAIGEGGVPLPLLAGAGLAVESLPLPPASAPFDLSLELARLGEGLRGRLVYDAALFDRTTVARLGRRWGVLLAGIAERPAARLSDLPLLALPERWQLLGEWNDTDLDTPAPAETVWSQLAAQAARTPEAPALTFDGRTLTYRALHEQAERLAARLRGLGAGPEVPVAICAERGTELVVALLAVLAAGGAYLPLDPGYPRERLAFMLADSNAPLLLTQARLAAGLPEHRARVVLLDGPEHGQTEPGPAAALPVDPENLAYVIYTSGSTGRPKGVGVRHRGVVNFFAGMDRAVGCGPGDRLLAVTSVSFDISVLELLWTLARGAEVILAGEGAAFGGSGGVGEARPSREPRKTAVSLFYFASASGDAPVPAGGRYRLLLEGAKLADRRGFTAVWTPERHFHAFGGLYPNPSVTGAAVAAVTERVAVRAGSVVLPLHDPVRVAEEWAVVDNLSHGRAGIAFASGWHADDFVFRPESYAARKDVLFQGVETVRRLWRGEAIRARGGAGREIEIRILPRPVQAELPVWITAAGAPETFARAGEIGAHLLTHLLGQTIEEVAEKVAVYRAARAAHGHDPEAGCVTLMLHTLVGEDRAAVREAVRGPFTAYLASSLGLVGSLARSLGLGADLDALGEQDRADLLAFAFERYFETGALFGDRRGCLALLDRLSGIGVDEVACLIDFGVDDEAVLSGLERLAEVREAAQAIAAPLRSAPPEERSLAALAARHRPTLLQCTPSLLRLLSGRDGGPEGFSPLVGLRTLLLGGEALPAALAAAVREALPARLINLYGPTETTVWSAAYPVDPAGETGARPLPTVPLGRPIANTRLHLLDRRLQPVPAGAPGALHIAGSGLARGYLGRPEQTAARFLPDSFSPVPGSRLYDTGDLARRDASGTLEFLGRADQQVKLRGFRIELGEVEAALAACPEVREAVAVVRRTGSGDRGDDRLIAYCTISGSAAGEPRPGLGAELRGRLAERLPEPMVPAAVVVLPALPLTPNRKVDRGALARSGPLPEAEAGDGYRPPRTPTEERLAALFSQLLAVARVGVDDNFFRRGGHSLLATQLLSRIRDTFRVELPLRSVFEAPTVAGLAAWLDTESRSPADPAERLAARSAHTKERSGVGRAPGGSPPPLVPVPREGDLPLSFVQQRLWFLDQLEPGNPAYNNAAALRLLGPLDAAALSRSLAAVVSRHEALRTTFPPDPRAPGRPRVVIAPEPDFSLAIEELAGTPAEREAAVLARAREDARQPFDLARGPLLRARLLRLGAADHVVLLAVHHIVSDGWSLGVLVREVGEHYRTFVTGGAPALPALPVQYADYAAWQRRWLAGEALAAELGYWRQALAGAPTVLELPADRPRPAVARPHGRTRWFALPRALTERLRAVSRGEGATLFMTLLAAFDTLLGAMTGRRDLLVGSPVANRGRSELEGLIGFFVNTLALRADLAGDPPFPLLLARVREATLAAYAHQEVPFDQVVEALGIERDLSHSPVFQVAFALQNAAPPLDLPGIAATPLAVDSGTVKFDWDLSFEETGEGLAGRLAYSTDLFDGATVERAIGHLGVLLQAIATDPGRRLSALPLLSAAERHQLVEWNDPRVAYRSHGFVHRLIAGRAASAPDAVAAVAEGACLTYGELLVSARRAAAALAALGVGPERIAGVFLERSLALVVGLLAVWQAGGAYLPLDPEDPPERLAFLLADAGAAALVTEERLRGVLPEAARALPTLVLDGVHRPRSAEPAAGGAQTRPSGSDTLKGASSCAPSSLDSADWGRCIVSPDHPAYVLYTSGSTGLPKGVVVSHRALANRVRYAVATDVRAGDAFLQKTTASFDVSLLELFAPLVAGGRTVLARPGGQRDSAYLVRRMAEEGVTHVSFPPVLLDVLLAEGALDDCRGLKNVVTGGETVPLGLPARFFARLQDRSQRIELYNRYGPTEATISVTSWRCQPGEAGRTLPIGRPTAGAEVHLLDADLRPVPIGVAGEICLGGLCLARGYLNRPELTAERFIPHPWGVAGERLYRTGDLARHRPDGAVEFLGRGDRQVKIRGFRVELEEIATVLAGHPAVGEAVVVLREEPGLDGAAPYRALVAYWVPRPGAAARGEDELRAFLKGLLPDYMLPARFVVLAAFPVTRTGKVDLAALPAPDRSSAADTDPAGERTPTEELLAAIWAQVLGRERVGLDDNFFTLGGDSILSLQVVARANQAGLALSPRDVFRHQTLAELAAIVGVAIPGASASASPGGAIATGPVPLTPIQSWFFAREPEAPHHWNQAVLLALRRPVAREHLAAALGALLAHHDALRLRFFRDDETGEWRQRLPADAPADGPAPFCTADLSMLPAGPAAVRSGALSAAAGAVQGSLDLARGPLFRAVLFDLGEGEAGRLLLVAHHLVVDGVSWRILVEDLETACEQLERGASVTLPPRTTAFPVWAERLAELARTGARGEELDLWLADERAWVAPLPRDFTAVEIAAGNLAAQSGTVRVGLGAEETAAFLAAAPAAHAGVDEVLLAALAEALAAWSGARSLLVQVEGHGREEIVPGADLSRTVGWFTVLAPVLLALPETTDPGLLLRAVKDQVRALPDGGIGHGLLRYGGDPEIAARLAALPQPEIAFNYLGRLDPAVPAAARFVPAAEPTGPALGPANRRPHLLQIDAAVLGGRLELTWTFGGRLHRPATVERLAEAHLAALRRLVEHCQGAEDGGYSPSDFPDVALDQEQLELILKKVGSAGM